MPSSHAQSLFFFASYLSAAAASAPMNAALRVGAFGLLPLAAYLAWQRVLAGLHTPAQVGVGGLIGTTIGAAWFFAAQPALEDAVRGGGGVPVGSILALFVLGAGVVGSVERWKQKGRCES